MIVQKRFRATIGFPDRWQKVKGILETERAPVGKDIKAKEILQMVGIIPEKVVIINLKRSLEVAGGR